MSIFQIFRGFFRLTTHHNARSETRKDELCPWICSKTMLQSTYGISECWLFYWRNMEMLASFTFCRWYTDFPGKMTTLINCRNMEIILEIWLMSNNTGRYANRLPVRNSTLCLNWEKDFRALLGMRTVLNFDGILLYGGQSRRDIIVVIRAY